MNELSVYKAITVIQGELAKEGISKSRKNQMQGFAYRGIDDVYAALSPLLSANNLCILPRMITKEVVERTNQKGNALFYTTISAEFDIVSAVDGSRHTVSSYGEAMDSGDKSVGKAMSYAYKAMAFMVFAIPTEGDNDADASTHEVQAKPLKSSHKPVDGAFDSLTEERQNHIREVATNVAFYVNKADKEQALKEIEQHIVDNDEKVALWSLLDSKVRSFLKK